MFCFRLQCQQKPFSAASLPRLGSIKHVPCLITPTQKFYTTSIEPLPRVTRLSVWQSIIPKFLRQPQKLTSSAKSSRPKEWNPATFFIVIFLLIGSNSIQMITLKNEVSNFNRKADAKINLLKEIIDRVQQGETVDVKGLLGSGNKVKEQEWAGVLQEIEEEDRLWQVNKKRRNRKQSSNQATESTLNNPQSPSEVVKDKARQDAGSNEAGEKVGDEHLKKIPRAFY